MRLSIITINYNNKAGLQKTIDSVICQTWKDYEWIIIDGGSSDGSKELIEQYQQHFAYWCSEPDKGVYNAMNKGIKHAKGEYLNFMNSGDCFYEDNTLYKVFGNNCISEDMIYGDWIRQESERNVFFHAPQEASLYTFYVSNICHQALFIKTLILKTKGYDESYHIYADWARWIELMIDSCTSKYIPVTICYFDAQNGISNRMVSDMDLELEEVKAIIPNSFRFVLDNYYIDKQKLTNYENNQIIKDVYLLINDNPLFCRLIHLFLFFLKCVKRIIHFG
jgi:glycosyltransferase involved in cell wall biosynthesis